MVAELVEQIQSWLHYCRRMYTARTCEHYEMVLRQLQEFIVNDGEELTTEVIEGYLDKLLENNTRRTFNCYLTAIRSCCRWRSSRYHVNNPAESIHIIKEDPPQQRILSGDEYAMILKHARGQDLQIIEMLAHTGLRRAEFYGLTWDCISPDLKFLKLKGKGRRARVIPLNQTCRDILRRYKRIDGPVQITRRYPGKTGTYWLCKRIARDIGIPKFGPHALRHLFCTRLVKAGVSIYLVSKLMGHSSVLTTSKIYAHILNEDLLGKTDVLDL